MKTEQEVKDAITTGIVGTRKYTDSVTGKTYLGEKQYICQDAVQQLAITIGKALGVIEEKK